VNCVGVGVCNTGEVVCGDGPCEVTCGGINACAGWTVQCGADRCAVTCAGIVGAGFSVSENGACEFEQTLCPI
jgi:hypothetical protein